MRIFLFLLLATALQVEAQTYANRPVKLLVPFPAGSATDQVARLTGAQLQEALGQPFVVENKAGAQGAIAAAEVAKSAPDGYTLLLTTNTPQAANVCLGKPPAEAKGGKLRGLAVTSKNRTPLAPELPAIAEELRGYELIAWFALMAPAKTPADVVQKLYAPTVAGLAKPDVKEKFAGIGVDTAPMNPAELGRFIQSEIAHWARLVKLAGIQPE